MAVIEKILNIDPTGIRTSIRLLLHCWSTRPTTRRAVISVGCFNSRDWQRLKRALDTIQQGLLLFFREAEHTTQYSVYLAPELLWPCCRNTIQRVRAAYDPETNPGSYPTETPTGSFRG